MPTLLDRTFKLNEHGTSVKTEILAGVTTFLTMAYILFVNPTILSSTGMPKDAVFVATCVICWHVVSRCFFYCYRHKKLRHN